jgi:hypothetical protein
MAVSQSDLGTSGAWVRLPLRDLHGSNDHFVVASELVTSRGLVTQSRARQILTLARDLSQHPRIDVLSITDNPGRHAMLAADTLGTDLILQGRKTIFHLACKRDPA